MSTSKRKQPSKMRASIQELRYVPTRPVRPNPGEIVTRPRNPPGDVPKITEAERIRYIEGKAPEDDLALRALTELERIARKKEWAKDQPDGADREASADASRLEIIPMIEKVNLQGAVRMRGQKSGGDNAAVERKRKARATQQKVLAEYQRLIAAGRGSREVAGIIANKIGLSPSQVRKILAANRKPRTS